MSADAPEAAPIDVVKQSFVKALDLPRTPEPAEIFSADFLPPPAERLRQLTLNNKPKS